MANFMIHQKPAGQPADTSVFAIDILQNGIWVTKSVSWATMKSLIAAAESLTLDNGKLIFTTPDGVAHEVLSVDATPTDGSDNPVASNGVYDALAAKQDALTFDQVPTDGSTNPVESNGIYDALATKQDTLTFDTAPTDGSTNPVTSAGIYTAISAITTGIDWKEAVATYADIATTYPNPQDGWTVTTLDDDHTYRYTGTDWVDMFSLITLASAVKDGLMSSSDFSKLLAIEAQANKTVVSNTLTPTTTREKIADITDNGTAVPVYADNATAVIVDLTDTQETAEGNPVTLQTVQEGYAKAVTIKLTPKQDLHGYDKPWPGGGGKNKLDEQAIKDNLGDTALHFLPILLPYNTAVTFSDDYGQWQDKGLFLAVTTASSAAEWAAADKVFIIDSNAENRNSFTFTTFGQQMYLRFYGDNNYYQYATKIQIEIGATATAYAPYSNICPIEGYEEASAKRTGVNQWDEEWEVGMIDNSGVPVSAISRIRSKNFIPVLPNTTYYSKNMAWLFFYGNNTTYTSFIDKVSIVNGTFTVPATAHYMKFYTASGYGETYNHDISLNYPATDTEYHAYDGTATATAEFAETIYGAEGDAAGGEWRKTFLKIDLSTLTWERAAAMQNYRFSAYVPGIKENTANTLCSQYSKIASSYSATDDGYHIVSGKIYLYIDAYSQYTAAEFKTAMSGVEFSYELATPVPFQTAPAPLTLRKGNNTITTDGDSVKVKYNKLALPDIGGIGRYISALEARVAALEGNGNRSLSLMKSAPIETEEEETTEEPTEETTDEKEERR